MNRHRKLISIFKMVNRVRTMFNPVSHGTCKLKSHRTPTHLPERSKLKRVTVRNVGDYLERVELLHVAGSRINRYHHFGKSLGNAN